jgi:aminotransferase
MNQYTMTWGLEPLRIAIADHLERSYGLAYDPHQEITVTCGVTEAIMVALMSLLNGGDEVLVIEPYHESYVPAILFAGGKPVFVPLHGPQGRLEGPALRKALTPRTRAIILNSPHNPSGRVFTGEELAQVAELCTKHGLVAITDEIYERIIYDGRRHVPLATLPAMWERTLTISGLSKTFAVTGWRLGYVCAPAELSRAIRTIHDYTTICAPAPLQAAAVTAMGMGEDYFHQLVEGYTARRDLFMHALGQVNLRARSPEGAYYVLADFSEWGFPGDDHAFARWLAKDGGVAVVPGSPFFGLPARGRHLVRFAFPKQLDTLAEAGERLRRKFANRPGPG